MKTMQAAINVQATRWPLRLNTARLNSVMANMAYLSLLQVPRDCGVSLWERVCPPLRMGTMPYRRIAAGCRRAGEFIRTGLTVAEALRGYWPPTARTLPTTRRMPSIRIVSSRRGSQHRCTRCKVHCGRSCCLSRFFACPPAPAAEQRISFERL